MATQPRSNTTMSIVPAIRPMVFHTFMLRMLCVRVGKDERTEQSLPPFHPFLYHSSFTILNSLFQRILPSNQPRSLSSDSQTTMGHTRSYINLIQQAQNQGYSVSLIYFWLNSPELAIERVKQRVANGGHDVPAPIIRRRYRSGLENFFRIYMPCVDYWMLADNSCTPRVIVADAFRLGDEVHIYNQELFTKIRSYVN